MGQSRGWLANRNSITPSLALCVSGEFVLTTMPGCTGHAQDATGFGARSTSTRHIRQLPAMRSFLHAISSDTYPHPLWHVLMVTISRDCNASLLTGLYQRRASFYLDLLAIDCKLDHVCPSPCRRGKTSVKSNPRGALGAHGSAE